VKRLGVGPGDAAVVEAHEPVWDVICRTAAEAGADLIVLGSHGRSGVRRLVLGSVAEHVLRRTSVPVLAVK
jgi:nucleotide-binding universal stress UspA family protein